MRQKIKRISAIALTPSVIVLAVSLVLILLNIFLAAKTRPFNSDDVSWQNILLSWRPYNGHTAYLGGADNFVLKTPLFVLLGHFFGPSRKLLVLESGIFAVFTFTAFYVAALYFLKKLSIKLTYRNLLPFLWFASFGYYIAQLYLNPILRNFEVGLSFIVFVLGAKIYYKEIEPLASLFSKLMTLVVCVILGALIYNDPYFLYFTVLPAVILFTGLFTYKKCSKRQVSLVFGATLLSLVFSKLIAHAVAGSGAKVLFTEPPQFVTFDKLFSNIAFAIHGVLVIFGADFFGKNAVSLPSFSALLNLFVVVFIFYGVWRILRAGLGDKREFDSRRLWPAFFAALGLFTLLVYSVNNLITDIQTYRYLIIMAFAFVLLLAIIAASAARGRGIITVVILAATVFNMGVSFTPTPSGQLGSANNQSNSENFRLIGTMRSLGLTKGYAPYWDGNINSYLSRGSVEFLPIICVNSEVTVPDNFLVDSSQFTRPAGRTFYVIDPDLSFPPTCPQDQIIKQFGPPARTLVVPDKTIFIYNYDIGSKM